MAASRRRVRWRLTSCQGKNLAKGEEASAARCFYRHRGASGWQRTLWVSNGSRCKAGPRRDTVHVGNPCFGRCRTWVWSFWSRPGPLFNRAGPNLLTHSFFFYSKLAQICKLQNRPFLSFKVFQDLHECTRMNYEQLYFWKKVKIRNIIWIKNLGIKLLLNLSQIYLMFKHDWKNLINSIKFLFSLTFQNVNLDWYGCMLKFADSIQAPFTLVWK
jgi:hypothetical protein